MPNQGQIFFGHGSIVQKGKPIILLLFCEPDVFISHVTLQWET